MLKTSRLTPGSPASVQGRREFREYREALMRTISDLAPEHGVRPLCHALGVAPATYYQHRKASRDAAPAAPVAAPPSAPANRSSERALSVRERTRVLGVLPEPHFVNLAPVEIYAALLDEGTYLCIVIRVFVVLGRFLAGLIFGISMYSLPTLVIGAVALVVAATVATLVPARRVARADPVNTLRRS